MLPILHVRQIGIFRHCDVDRTRESALTLATSPLPDVALVSSLDISIERFLEWHA